MGSFDERKSEPSERTGGRQKPAPQSNDDSDLNGEQFLRWAEAIADGEAVPLDEPGIESPHGERFANLRAIDAIARLYRDSKQRTRSTEPSDEHEDTVPERWGHLLLREKLGGGGGGRVFRAHDTNLQLDVALKLPKSYCSKRDSERFLREARLLAKVDHPHVITVYGADEHEGQVGLWTELIRGRTLEEALERSGPMSAAEAASIGVHLCSALAACHAVGLVHGDVKTTNVMRRDDDGRMVLMDFGSVREVAVQEPGARLAGTPLTMAPELILERRAPTPAVDVYGVGVLLYRMVTGRFPVDAKNFEELREKHARGEKVRLLDRNPHLDSGFVSVVERALETDPDRRYKSMGELQAALLDAPVPPSPPPGRKLWDILRQAMRPRSFTLERFTSILTLLAVLVGVAGLGTGGVRADVSLFRHREGSTSLLHDHAEVRPGDEISLELRSNREVYVYVLNESANDPGNVNVLFPLPELPETNPMPRGTTRLPGTFRDRQLTWPVADRGGQEMILVVASTRPVNFMEELIVAGFGDAESRHETRLEIDPEKTTQMRGFGLPEIPESARLDWTLERLQALDRAQLWYRVIELANP